MTYRVYIIKDYKTGKVKVCRRPRRLFLYAIFGISLLTIATGLVFTISNNPSPQTIHVDQLIIKKQTKDYPNSLNAYVINTHSDLNENLLDIGLTEPDMTRQDEPLLDVQDHDKNNFDIINPDELLTDVPERLTNPNWRTVTVKPGDSLALIFSRLGLSPGSLYNIMSLGKEVERLERLQPGQTLNFNIENNELSALEYEIGLTDILRLTKKDNEFSSEIISQEPELIVKNTNVVIKDSLFLSGKRVGLSDKLIMQLVAIYGWDIDFALDIREGDSFTLIYEEQYKEGVKVTEGPIIAAEFINRNQPLRAIRYAHSDGHIDYYSENGDAMRKAFLRTPVNFTRISSRFSLKRKHPVLNKIRAHKGIDYAAPIGTPVKATGNGIVTHARTKGGYGKMLILKHGGKYSTVYAHLHRYAKNIRKGARVKQGQIIGYVGKSGLATGPHLHYEFRINGIHRNPLTVKLPKVESIRRDELPKFLQTTTSVLAELDHLTGKGILTAPKDEIIASQPSPIIGDG